MLDCISAVLQDIIKVRGNKGADFKNSRSSQAFVDAFAVRDFFSPCESGISKLLYAVGSVCIKIGKSQNPAIIQFHLVRRPGIQGHIFDLLNCSFHIIRKTPFDKILIY